MDGVVEIITGRERRQRWSLQNKVRIVADQRAGFYDPCRTCHSVIRF